MFAERRNDSSIKFRQFTIFLPCINCPKLAASVSITIRKIADLSILISSWKESIISMLKSQSDFLRCGPEEIRTLNLLHAMQARYRCATGPSATSWLQGKPTDFSFYQI